MVFKGAINKNLKAYILYRVKDRGVKPSEVVKDVSVSLATVYRVKNDGMKALKHREKKCSPGRPRKVSERTERTLLRQVKVLRKENPNFTSGNLIESCGIDPATVCNRTVRRVLNRNGFHYRQSRKKGVLTAKDIKRRLKFAKEVKKNHPRDLWTRKINFYLDGVSFYYKRNPAGQARAPQGRIWRTKREGLAEGCTAKGKKEGSGGKVVKVFVSISYNKGVIACDAYETLNGKVFEDYVKNRFPTLFQRADKAPSRLWLQDGDPSQNAAGVKKQLKKMKKELFCIPPRSPDLNPIENLFHLVRKEMTDQALKQNITKESYKEFQSRVIETFLSFSTKTIDNIIESMNNRIDSVIKNKGNRIKY